ncbi:cell wall glucanosyltransferase Mwg2 [Plectosphaerella cucumerina]|uniref:Cell wall glucanosyltransferase Mwg2 n=1 Tax=Plectosphaerella cucumerina TaxID=40658 RepID=A0A8K0TLL4_9PEZI|nr:cell wall glucanosyltransferase Mwg2 [Plectosphaerella cucumerina]
MHASVKNVALALALAGLSSAQTFSKCNPVKGDKCSPNPAFGGSDTLSFKSASKIDDIEGFFEVDGGIKYDPKYEQLSFEGDKGMKMSIFEEKHAPTLYSHDFLFFGHVEVELRAAPGAGIITSVVLQSDTLDEIDWEWIGNEPDHVQTNVFFQGIENYNHGGDHPISNAMSEFHTYAIDWTPEKIVWSINGNVVREHLPSSGVFPQTPCQLRIGTWVGGKGDPNGDAKDRIAWAGGLAQWDQAPFNAYYRRIQIIDYAGGYDAATKYEYTNTEGTWESIKVTGGKKVGFPGEHPPTKNNNEILESSSEIESATSTAAPSTTVTKTKVTTTAAPTSSEVSSAIETETSSEISSELPSETESSSIAVRTTTVTSATTAPSSSAAPAEEEEEEETVPSGAASLQRSGLFLGAALLAGALML